MVIPDLLQPLDDPEVPALLRRCTFPPAGSTVACGVSGGADSSALLVLAVGAGLSVTAVHVDHALRPGSAEEAGVVADLAERLGTRFRSVSAPVDHGSGLEERARTLRHAVLGPDSLLGHTADDQAETVLLRMLRGTGPAGLAAMRPDRHPLLSLRRSETVALCARMEIPVVQDPSNDSPMHTRNRIRHEVMPLLDDVGRRDVVPLLARLARLSAEQADLVDELSRVIDPSDASALADAPRPLAAAAIRRWLRVGTGLVLPPAEQAIARVLDVASGAAVACEVHHGWRVQRSNRRMRLVRTGADAEGGSHGPAASERPRRG